MMKQARSLLAVALLLHAFTVSAQDRVTLNSITKVEVKNGHVEITGSRRPSFTTFTMVDPPRLVIDLSEAVFVDVPKELKVNDGTITSIKVATYGGASSAIARVLIGFEREVETDIASTGTSLIVKLPPDPKVQAALVAQKQEADRAAKEKREAEERARLDAERAEREEKERQVKAAEEARLAKLERERLERERLAAEKAEAERQARAAAEVAKKKAEEERLAKLEAERLEKERAQAEKEAAARAAKEEADRRAREAAEAKQRAEDERQARLAAEKAAREEKARLAKLEAEQQAAQLAELKRIESEAREQAEREKKERELAARQAEADRKEAARLAAIEAKRSQEERAAAEKEARRREEEEKRQAALDAKKAAEEQKRLAEEAKRREAEEKRLAAKEAERARKQRELEAAAASTPSPSELASNGRQQVARMTFVGFKQDEGVGRVFFRTSSPVRYRVGEDSDRQVVLTLENTQIGLPNNQRIIDASFFDTAVSLVRPEEQGGGVKVFISLKRAVAYRASQTGNELTLEFERPE